MRKLHFVAMAVMAAMVCGCGGGDANKAAQDSVAPAEQLPYPDDGRVHSSMVQVVATDDTPVVYVDGAPYNGDVWTDDNTGVESFKDGKLYSGIVFHSNGQPAMELVSQEKDVHTVRFYDENGKEIDKQAFTAAYGQLIIEARAKFPVH